MAINNTGFPFKFWCQKVLPLTYDNSLSYYEVLCKVTKDLQTVIEHDLEQDENIENLQGDISGLENAIEELKGCIAIEYDENNMYSEGMFCLMNDDLYICTESTTGEFDRNCWSHTDFGSQFTSTNNDISSMDTRVLYTERAIERIDGTIGDIQGDISTINTRIGDIIKKFAPTYDENLSYSIGQYCTYMRGFYVCIADTTGTFDSECWDSTDVGYELSDLYSRMDGLETLVNAVRGTLESVRDISAKEYNKTATYNQGDYCTFGWVLYKCNSDNVTGNFDDTYWDETTVGDELILAMNSGGGSSDIPTWDSEYSYGLFDFVKYADDTYMSINSMALTGVAPPSNPTDWVEMKSLNYFASALNTVAKVAGISDGQTISDGTIYAIIDDNIAGAERVAIARGHQPYIPAQPMYLDRTDFVEELNRTNRVIYNEGVSTYDSTATYNTGDLVVNFWTILRCKEDNVTGTFDNTKWERTSVFEEILNLKNKLSTLSVYQNDVRDRLIDNVREAV